jgi:hypothetical protein
MTIVLEAIPSILALVVLLGMIYRGAGMVQRQLEATQQNTEAIQALTVRLIQVEKVNIKTNVIAADIKDRVTNGT